jgi:hypothetical protein
LERRLEKIKWSKGDYPYLPLPTEGLPKNITSDYTCEVDRYKSNDRKPSLTERVFADCNAMG